LYEIVAYAICLLTHLAIPLLFILETSNQVGHCTHLEWMSPKPACLSTLAFLAASFQGGIALYHVALPVRVNTTTGVTTEMPPPTSSTQLSQTIAIQPFCMARWGTVYEQATVAWLDLGPHAHPTVSILLQGKDEYKRIVVATCPLPMYSKDTPGRTSTVTSALEILSSVEWNAQGDDTSTTADIPCGLFTCSYLPAIVYHTHNNALYTMDVITTGGAAVQQQQQQQQQLPLLGHVFCSIPAGLTSSGNVWLGDAESNKQGILHVFSVLQCERRKNSNSNSSENEMMLDWSPPARRHWLVRTLAGDCKDAISVNNTGEEKNQDNNTNDGNGGGGNTYGGDPVITGGAISQVVCELGGIGPLSSLVPYHIVRSSNGRYSAVLFRAATTTTNNKASKVAMIEHNPPTNKEGASSSSASSSSSSFGRMVQLLDGRDICFLPSAATSADDNSNTTTTIGPLALVLSKEGGSVVVIQRKPDKQSKKVWQEGTAFRPILGVEAGDSFVQCRRLVLSKCQSKIGLLAVGTKISNGKSCILSGPLEEFTTVAEEGDAWSNLLPNIDESPVFWFDTGEEVTLVVSLPWEGDIRGGVAVATSKRILMLSPNMKRLSEMSVASPPNSLVPMGSFTVAFSSCDYKIRYLCGLQGPYGNGLIATLPMPRFGYNPHLLLAVRPDRLVYYQWHCGTRLVEKGQPSSNFLLPTAITRPALLLEPFIANAISTGGDQTSTLLFLRTVAEKFGRKVASLTHGEGEGIGNLGAGLTPRTFELLSHHGLTHAASYLLTGTPSFDRSANATLLPKWMPLSAKMKGSMDADASLQLIANGDQYFSEYIKSPDNNMSATLPRPTDPSAFLSNDFARGALLQGRVLDALKMLDLAGTESADAMLLQLSLALQMDPSADVTKVLQALCQSDSQGAKTSSATAAASLAALALELKSKKIQSGQPTSGDFSKRWMQSLAPSLQRGKRMGRLRQRIIGEEAFSIVAGKHGQKTLAQDQLFKTSLIEAKHVWYVKPVVMHCELFICVESNYLVLLLLISGMKAQWARRKTC
jgi:hypothetical protein